jgi:catechol 2,3-dioxygenase-like lactoylglutathione lyase family enzyme
MTDRPAPAHHGCGAPHLAFAIPFGELAVWEDHLARQDLSVETRIGWPRSGTSLYFRDPDGHSLEVATPGLWANR